MRELRVSLTIGAVTLLVLGLPAGASAQDEEGGQCSLEGTSLTAQVERLVDEAAQMDSTREAEARRKLQEASTRLRLAFKNNPDDPAAYWLAARTAISLQEFARADSMLKRFTSMKPGCSNLASQARASAWVDAYNAGIRAYNAGDDQRALEMFEQANQMQDDPRALNNAALLRQQQGELERSEELYRRSLEVAEEPDQKRAASINLAELLRGQGRAEEARAVYENYIQENPEATTARINYAVTLRDAGMQDSARAIFDQLLQREDMGFADWFNVGVGLMESQDYQQAAQAFDGARQKIPYDKGAMENHMNALLGAGELRRGVALADTLVNWYPYDKQTYRQLAQALDRMGEPQRVQQYLSALQGLELEIPRITLVQRGSGQPVLRGQIMGGGPAAGQTVNLPIEFLDNEGNVVAETEAEVQVPDGDQLAQFEVSTPEGEVTGFRYGRVGQGS